MLIVLLFANTRHNHEFAKTIVDPARQIVPRSALRGLKDEYGHIEDDVLLIEGEIHLERKPVRYVPRLEDETLLTYRHVDCL